MSNASCLVFTEHQGELPASLPLSQFRTNSLPTKVRAHGVITLGKCPKGLIFHFYSVIGIMVPPLQYCLSPLGKLCLQHENLVQKYLPVFARELEVGTEVAVRNNVVVIMCDLCVRYTNIVDLYIPNISACLRDNEAVIREQTLIMLTNLLQVGLFCSLWNAILGNDECFSLYWKDVMHSFYLSEIYEKKSTIIYKYMYFINSKRNNKGAVAFRGRI